MIIEAYHMVGLSLIDQGRMVVGKDHQEIITHAQERYQQICRDGYLMPAPQEERSFEKKGRTFALDHLAGDTAYIFLSIGKRYWNPLEASNFGFVFDAEQLAAQGAILRSRDLLQDYEEAHEAVTGHFIPYSDPMDWTPEQQAALFQSLEDGGAMDAFPSNDTYYALREAIERQDESYPHAKEAIAMLKERMRDLQEGAQLSGDAALQALRSGKAQGYELLVHAKLPLEYALFRIAFGKMKVAIVDLDGVVANSDERFARATTNGKVNWTMAFDPAAVPLDTLIAGCPECIDALEAQGYRIVFLTSRPETMKEATASWLHQHRLLSDARELITKPLSKQYTKTKVWKAEEVTRIAAGATEVVFIDDEQGNIAEVQALSLQCILRVSASLAGVE